MNVNPYKSHLRRKKKEGGEERGKESVPLTKTNVLKFSSGAGTVNYFPRRHGFSVRLVTMKNERGR